MVIIKVNDKTVSAERLGGYSISIKVEAQAKLKVYKTITGHWVTR